MGYKTILVHCDADKAVPKRLDVAVDLAKRFDAHLVGVHARPLFEATAFFANDSVPTDTFYRAYEDAVTANEKVAASAFEKATKGKPFAAEWRVANGASDAELAVQSRYADLVVLGQSSDENLEIRADLPEVVALSTGRPVLVVPYIGAKKAPGKRVMLCWNASRQAARAAADALPFLKAAEEVVVLVVEPKATSEGHGDEPGADVALWLSRHGVKVDVQREVAPDADIGAMILSRSADLDIDMIVMGVYGHSRVREFVMGGVSRTLLHSMTVPVFMAH